MAMAREQLIRSYSLGDIERDTQVLGLTVPLYHDAIQVHFTFETRDAWGAIDIRRDGDHIDIQRSDQAPLQAEYQSSDRHGNTVFLRAFKHAVGNLILTADEERLESWRLEGDARISDPYAASQFLNKVGEYGGLNQRQKGIVPLDK